MDLFKALSMGTEATDVALGSGISKVASKIGEGISNLLSKTQTGEEALRWGSNQLRYMRPTRYALDGLGLYPRLRMAHLNSVKALQEKLGMLETFRGELPQDPESMSNLFKYIENTLPPEKFGSINEKQKAFATKLDELFGEYYSKYANELGIKGKRENYLPHVFAKLRPRIADITTNPDFESLYPGFKFNKPRLGAEGYIEDPILASAEYIRDAERRIAFSPAVDYANKNIIHNPTIDPDVKKYVSDVFNWILFPNRQKTSLEKAIEPIVNKAVKLNYSGAIGSPGSALTNLMQIPLGTLPEIGMKYTLAGIKTLTNGAEKNKFMDIAKKFGIFEDTIPLESELGSRGGRFFKWMERLESGDPNATGTGIIGTLKRGGTMTPFKKAEEVNRLVTFAGAYKKAEDTFAAGKILNLRGLTTDTSRIIQNLIHSGRTKEAAGLYATEVVGKTQYFYGSIDTPLMLKHPLSKALFMFWSFPINTIEMFVRNLGHTPTKAVTYGLYSYLMYAFAKGLGIDLSPKVGTNVLPFSLSPIVKTFGDIGSVVSAWWKGDKLTEQKTLKDLDRDMWMWVPSGRFANKCRRFATRGLDGWAIKTNKGEVIGYTTPLIELANLLDLRSIDEREMVEGYYKSRYPGRFPDNPVEKLRKELPEWMHKFIQPIKFDRGTIIPPETEEPSPGNQSLLPGNEEEMISQENETPMEKT